MSAFDFSSEVVESTKAAVKRDYGSPSYQYFNGMVARLIRRIQALLHVPMCELHPNEQHRENVDRLQDKLLSLLAAESATGRNSAPVKRLQALCAAAALSSTASLYLFLVCFRGSLEGYRDPLVNLGILEAGKAHSVEVPGPVSDVRNWYDTAKLLPEISELAVLLRKAKSSHWVWDSARFLHPTRRALGLLLFYGLLEGDMRSLDDFTEQVFYPEE